MSHFMKGRRVELLSILEDFFDILMNIELRLLRNLDEITRLVIAGTWCFQIYLDRAEPLLLFKHSVKGCILVHTHIILQRNDVKAR